jgi:hypothetical protein
MTTRMVFALAAALTAAAPAGAMARDWDLLGAETLPAGTDVIDGRFGWPDLSMQYTHGVRPGFDVGGRFEFVYGVENRTDLNSKFGIAFAVPLRWELSHSERVKFLFHFDPGLRLYTYSPAVFGFQGPIGLVLEFPPAGSAPIKWGIGADFNMTLLVTGDGAPFFFFGPLVGPWMEYRVDSRFSLGVDSRFGAIIDAANGGTDSGFGFRLQMMLAYRL